MGKMEKTFEYLRELEKKGVNITINKTKVKQNIMKEFDVCRKTAESYITKFLNSEICNKSNIDDIDISIYNGQECIINVITDNYSGSHQIKGNINGIYDRFITIKINGIDGSYNESFTISDLIGNDKRMLLIKESEGYKTIRLDGVNVTTNFSFKRWVK